MTPKPLNDPTQQSDAEAAFWERTEREADEIAEAQKKATALAKVEPPKESP